MLLSATFRRFAIRTALLTFTFLATALFTAAYQQRPAPAKPQGMTVDSVIKLVQAGVGEDVIVARLRQANKSIELSDEDLIKLTKNNVSDNIQRVMIDPSAKVVPPPEPPPIPALRPVAPEPASTEVSGPNAPGNVAPQSTATDPDSPGSPHDPGIYLYSKDSGGKARMTILDHAAVQYPDCVPGRFLNRTEANFAGAQAAIRAKDTQPVFYFSFENTGGSSQFADASLTTPNQFALIPVSMGKKGRQVRLAVQCTAPTKTAVKFKVERDRQGLYKLTLLEPLAAGDYAFFASGALPQDVFEFGVDAQ